MGVADSDRLWSATGLWPRHTSQSQAYYLASSRTSVSSTSQYDLDMRIERNHRGSSLEILDDHHSLLADLIASKLLPLHRASYLDVESLQRHVPHNGRR